MPRSLPYHLPSVLQAGDGPPQIRPYHTIIELGEHRQGGPPGLPSPVLTCIPTSDFSLPPQEERVSEGQEVEIYLQSGSLWPRDQA